MSSEKIIEVELLPVNIESGITYSINQANPNSYTHGMFKYPCKFIPEIPRWAIKKYLDKTLDNAMVFDPFSGSGTTLLEANLNGIDACGTEIDEIAKLIITVKTTTLKKEELKLLDYYYLEIINVISDSNANVFRPEINNLEHWFSDQTIIDLGKIRFYLNNIENKHIRDFFELCLVSIVKKVSYADDTSPKPYVSSKIIKNPQPVEKEFSNIYQRYKKMVIELSNKEKLGKTKILNGDALNFSMSNEIDLAITSPPYINAFDYGRTLRLENLWLSTLTEEQLRKKKKFYVGTEKINVNKEKDNLEILEKSELLKQYYAAIKEIDEKRALIVKKFFEDMEVNLQCVYKQLKKNGVYVIVIGNSNIRKNIIESWKVIEEIAKSIGYKTEDYFNYIIRNPYIRIPRKGVGGQISKDYVLILKKER